MWLSSGTSKPPARRQHRTRARASGDCPRAGSPAVASTPARPEASSTCRARKVTASATSALPLELPGPRRPRAALGARASRGSTLTPEPAAARRSSASRSERRTCQPCAPPAKASTRRLVASPPRGVPAGGQEPGPLHELEGAHRREDLARAGRDGLREGRHGDPQTGTGGRRRAPTRPGGAPRWRPPVRPRSQLRRWRLEPRPSDSSARRECHRELAEAGPRK